ncbi:hypothetical protein JT05_06710 [Desulfosporosinus sp. Tol-M]|nr:hypothetical protein JT05_06710 [Desulfosporosinus sp. Tol-M]
MDVKNNTIKNLGRESILYFLSLVLPKAINFLLLPLYSNLIDPDEYAIMAYTQKISAFTVIIASLCLNFFYMRYYAQVNDKKKLNGTAFWFMFLMNIAVTLLCFLVLPIVFKSTNSVVKFFPYMLLELIIAFFTTIEFIPIRTMRMSGEVKFYFVRAVFRSLLGNGLGVLFVAGLGMGILGRYLAEAISGGVFATALVIYMIQRSYFRIDKNLLKEGLKFSLPILPSALVEVTTPLITTILIERALSMTELGIYSMGMSLSQVVFLVTGSVSMTFEPELYRKSAQADFPEYARKIKNINMVFVAWFAIGCGLFVREVVLLVLSEKYFSVWPIVQIMMISYCINVLKGFYNQLIIIQGKTKALTVANVINFVVSAAICYFLLPLFGENMLGWLASITSFAMFLVYYTVTDKSNYRTIRVSRDFFVIGIIGVLLYASRITHAAGVWPSIGLKLIIFAAFTIILMLIYGLNPKIIIGEIRNVRKSMSKVI